MQPQQRSIVVLGDIHGASGGVSRIVRHLQAARPDLVALVGDLGVDLLWSTREPADAVRRWQRSIDDILEALEPLGAPVVLVPGNHDQPQVALRGGGATNLDGRVLDVAGLRVAGIGGAGPAFFGLPYEWSEETMTERLQAWGWAQAPPDVVVSHAPPLDSGLDRLLDGTPVGSAALRAFVEAAQPPLYVCGHIHEAVGHCRIGSTLAVNAGRLIWASQYVRFGRPAKGSTTAYQYYRVELAGRVPQRLERVRLSCRGALRVLQRQTWSAADGFVRATPDADALHEPGTAPAAGRTRCGAMDG